MDGSPSSSGNGLTAEGALGPMRPMGAKLTIVNAWDWLNEDGSLPEHPPRLRNRALRVAQCIEYGGPLPHGQCRETLLPCIRRPAGEPCTGLLWVLKELDSAIFVFCLSCGTEEFLIYEWEDTDWADGQMVPVEAEEVLGGDPIPVGPDDARALMDVALKALQSSLSTSDVVEAVSTATSPAQVLKRVLESAPPNVEETAVGPFVAALIQVWNNAPRPELDGQTPRERHRQRSEDAQGNNDGPRIERGCPCGSGKAFERCCLPPATVH